MINFTKSILLKKNMNNTKKEVFYKGKKINILNEVERTDGKCTFVYEGKKSYIEYAQYKDNQELHISILKVHELCRGKGIGVMLIATAIHNCKKPISKISIKACAETEIINEYKKESDYKKPRTQEELIKYYNNFTIIQNGEVVNFDVSF